ncbi:hypothetical protein AB0I66_21395 [Streptomyces sp. NPDC050439]|uniref:hypothetical protein n=1 Tax=unclassified Streptomyces TaxID=2593676 RepID=UPI00341E7DFA
MTISLPPLGRIPVLGLIRGTGAHRPVRRKTPSDRRPIFPPAPHTGVVPHGFRHCQQCGTDTVAILHREGHTCGDCGREHYTKDGAE